MIAKLDKLPDNANQQMKTKILTGAVTRLATSQTGSRYLQKELTKASPSLIEFMLSEVNRELSKIMVNQYGNYFFQKLLSNCSADQRLQILDMI